VNKARSWLYAAPLFTPQELYFMRRLLLIATAVALIQAAPAFAQSGAENPVVAKVNGAEIHRADVEAAYQSLPDEYRQMPLDALFDPLLQRVIDTRLLADLAAKQGLPEQPEVQAALERAREGALRDQVIMRALEKGTNEAALRAAYDEAKKAPDFTVEEVHARHILLDNEADARAVIAELGNGGDFTALAKAKSKDPSAAQNSGDLGFFRREAMVPEFSAAAFAMEPGTWSKEPVKSQFGWHVILVEEKRSSEPTFEEREDALKEELSRQIVTALLEDARQGADVQRFNIDGSPAAPEAATPESGAAEPAAPEAAPQAQ
jgi:peptidyl-prolyl cis-trans isomerase C